MGAFFKDLMDWDRPQDHTKVRFGKDGYLVESNPTPQPYGACLTELLNYDAASYLSVVEKLRKALAEKKENEISSAYLQVETKFKNLPLYKLYLRKRTSPLIDTLGSEKGSVTRQLLADDGTILGRYYRAAEDLPLIQKRYGEFLFNLYRDKPSERKKGEKKGSMADLIYRAAEEALVSGVSLGGCKKRDPAPAEIQYEVIAIGKDRYDLAEKIYFDRLLDFCYIELMKGMQKGFVPKKCPNCGKWFLQEPGQSYTYCNNQAPEDKSKTCRDIGSAASFKVKVAENEIWAIYNRAYKKYFNRVNSYHTMTKAEFETWSREAIRLRDETVPIYNRASTSEGKTQVAERFRERVNEK